MFNENNGVGGFPEHPEELVRCECPADLKVFRSAANRRVETRVVAADVQEEETLQIGVAVDGRDDDALRCNHRIKRSRLESFPGGARSAWYLIPAALRGKKDLTEQGESERKRTRELTKVKTENRKVYKRSEKMLNPQKMSDAVIKYSNYQLSAIIGIVIAVILIFIGIFDSQIGIYEVPLWIYGIFLGLISVVFLSYSYFKKPHRQ